VTDQGNHIVRQAFYFLESHVGEALVIPSVRSRAIFVFISIWLAFWTLVGIAEIAGLRDEKVSGLKIVGLVGWSLAWLHATSTLVWMSTGREIVYVREGDLHITRRASILVRNWVYQGESIRDLYVEPRPFLGSTKGGAFPFFAFSRIGAVRFSYRGKQRDLALGLAEADAQAVHKWLTEQLRPSQ
jgi:hypothetical protein